MFWGACIAYQHVWWHFATFFSAAARFDDKMLCKPSPSICERGNRWSLDKLAKRQSVNNCSGLEVDGLAAMVKQVFAIFKPFDLVCSTANCVYMLMDGFEFARSNICRYKLTLGDSIIGWGMWMRYRDNSMYVDWCYSFCHLSDSLTGLWSKARVQNASAVNHNWFLMNE